MTTCILTILKAAENEKYIFVVKLLIYMAQNVTTAGKFCHMS